MKEHETEYWLRGALPSIPALLQPVAHALLQANMEIKNAMASFPEDKLWDQPAGMASPAFHLQHIKGVLDRLFTYADSKMLSQQQLDYLSGEGKHNPEITTIFLVNEVNQQITVALEYLKTADTDQLTGAKWVGRQRIPSTLIGLLFHAAEHTMRHIGQLMVTVNVIKAG